MNKTTLFVLDLDNTIADASHRYGQAGPEPARHDQPAYEHWLQLVQSNQTLLKDAPIPGMIDMCWGLFRAGHFVYITSRERKYRPVTQEWLRVQGLPTAPLYMRPDDNWEEAHELKFRTIDDLLTEYPDLESVVVVDDDPSGQLEKVCLKQGWTFLKAVRS